MENLLKKILTGMVILLVVIVAAGGLYLASMGGMDHGTTAAAPASGSDQKADSQKSSSTNHGAANSDKAGETGQQPSGEGPTGQQPGSGGQGVPPVIIQVQPPKADPGIYIDQIKEKLRSINETNSSIASNSGGHSETINGQAASPQGDMNQLHQNFYKLGKDIATMEQSLEKLSASVRDNQIPLPQQFSYNYPYGVTPYYSYPNANSQTPANPYYPNQSGQSIQPNQGHQPGNNQGGANPGNSGHSTVTNGQMNHGISLGNLINADSAKTLFTLMLLGSVVLAVISVVGFLTSLFKKEGQDRPGIGQHN